MTTTVDTTVRPDVDLEAFLAGEIELPCEALHRGEPCAEVHPDSLAEWVAFVSFPCGHHQPGARLLCDHCHGFAERGSLTCSHCGAPVTVQYREPLR